jgi:hypothetical protein
MFSSTQKPEIQLERIVSEVENGYLRAHQEKRRYFALIIQFAAILVCLHGLISRWRVFVLYGSWRVCSPKPIDLSHLRAAWEQVLTVHHNLLATYHLQQNGEWKAYVRFVPFNIEMLLLFFFHFISSYENLHR